MTNLLQSKQLQSNNLYTRFSKYDRWLVLLFFTFIAFLLFYRLDAKSISIWDEARLALNTAHMFMDGNYFYTNYNNAPDFWSTKPHLLILLQTLSAKLFGLTEASIRLPSAIAAFLSCVLIYHWMKKENYPAFYACLAAFAFVCTKFLIFHGARAGDYESLLILWQLIYCYATFQYVQTHQSKFLWIGAITLTLAVMTKGISGVLLIPGIIVFFCLRREFGSLLKNKSFYLGSIFFIICVSGYYFAHERLTPGYLYTVYINEIGGRYFKVIEGHSHSIWFYFNSLSLTSFYFLPIWLIGIVYLFLNKKIFYQNILLQFVLTLSFFYFIMITLSKTKLIWYSYQLYPFLGMSVAIFSHDIAAQLDNNWQKKWIKLLLFWIIIASFGAIIAVRASIREKHDITYFLKNYLKDSIPHTYKIVVENISQYNAPLDFQIKKYLIKTHHQMIKATINDLQIGDWVIMHNTLLNENLIEAELLQGFSNESYGIYKIKLKNHHTQ